MHINGFATSDGESLALSVALLSIDGIFFVRAIFILSSGAEIPLPAVICCDENDARQHGRQGMRAGAGMRCCACGNQVAQKFIKTRAQCSSPRVSKPWPGCGSITAGLVRSAVFILSSGAERQLTQNQQTLTMMRQHYGWPGI